MGPQKRKYDLMWRQAILLRPRLVGFSSRFIPAATIAEPLRALSRKGEKFEWKEPQEQAFQSLKQNIAGASILAYYDRNVHTKVIADASTVGLSAVLDCSALNFQGK